METVGVAEEQEDSWRQLEQQKNRKIHGDSWSNRRTGSFKGAGLAEEQEVSWEQGVAGEQEDASGDS